MNNEINNESRNSDGASRNSGGASRNSGGASRSMEEILKAAGVLHEGHFQLTSGRHSNKYLQCAKIFEYSKYSEPLCAELVKKIQKYDIDVVIGPAIGAITLSYEIGKMLGVKSIFAERENAVMTLRRGFSIEKGQRVLVVEDVVTTGGSVKEVINIVESVGGIVAAVGIIVDRTGGKIDFGYPMESAVSMDVISWEQAECPLCEQGLPIVKPGSRNSK